MFTQLKVIEYTNLKDSEQPLLIVKQSETIAKCVLYIATVAIN